MRTKRFEVKDGRVSIPIYQFSDGRFCVDTLLGKKRKRITRTSLDAAKIEARKLIAQIASGRAHEERMTLSEVEDYRLAKNRLAPFGISLLGAIEEWIAGHGKTQPVIAKTVPLVVEEFLASKRVEGVSFFHLEDRKYRLRKFAGAFPVRINQISTHEIEVWLNGLEVSGRTRNNYRNAVLQLFRYARSKRYLPRNEPTAAEDVGSANAREGSIEIYTPQELRLLLTHAPGRLLPFFAIGAFAGLRSQEIMRLDWSEIRFEQGFIEVTASKAKTASRRLVPLLPTLAAWLLPLRQRTGHVVGYTRNDVLCEARQRYCKNGIKRGDETFEFAWKPNALRHSYASYRLADIKDAARVALEMGNSPAMLFRNYRELVTEKQAADWFAVLPDTNMAKKLTMTPGRTA
ncbi:MAG: tyrosine-type recombinase/integrase [Chthoniobacterales bacterium]